MFNMGINKFKAKDKIKKHWKLFRKLWSQYERLCDELDFIIPTILEWPRNNAYWKVTAVRRRLNKNGMHFANFDGCSYELRDSNGVEYLKKPWRFATNIPGVREKFSSLCTRDHNHGSTCGRNAKHSQYYTPTMAILVHKAVADFFYGNVASGTVVDTSRSSVAYSDFVDVFGNIDSPLTSAERTRIHERMRRTTEIATEPKRNNNRRIHRCHVLRQRYNHYPNVHVSSSKFATCQQRGDESLEHTFLRVGCSTTVRLRREAQLIQI